MGDNTSPISVILVSSGSRGNKLLFRYPFQRSQEHPASQTNKPLSRYAVNNTGGDHAEDQDGDSRFSDVILATILATKSEMCGQKFELKIDNVRFVGHPTLLQHALGQVSKTDPSPKREAPTMILFNVVFALRANADPSVINCLHNLSRRIATVLQHEERRCQYLTREAKLILALQDEVSAVADANDGPQSPFHHILPKCKLARDLKEAYDRGPSPTAEGTTEHQARRWTVSSQAQASLVHSCPIASFCLLFLLPSLSYCPIFSFVSACSSLLPPGLLRASLHPSALFCPLAMDLAFLSFILISFFPESDTNPCRCLKAPGHTNALVSNSSCGLSDVQCLWVPAAPLHSRCTPGVGDLWLACPTDLTLLHSPYHALLLLSDEKSLLSELPLDCSPALVRVIKTTSAVKNLQQLAQDADLALLQVFQLAAHLVYWGKAIIIYPLCENNVYMLSPNASVCLYSPLAEQFSHQFPSHDLPSVLAKFSLPVSLSEFRNPLAPPVQETQLIQMVIWMLQHRLLVQLHTYVCLMASPSEDEPRPREDEVPFTTRVGGRSLSTPNALSFGSPTSSDDMTLTSPSMDNSSAELLPSGDSPLNKRMTENLLASLSEHERAAILSVPAAQNPEDLRMFARLLHYFRGRHHLEEIMYNENTRRSQLLMLFDKFRSVLVVTTHEDPVIAVFQALLT
ncbi:GATOR complex protein NPRL3 [Pteropus vampyrus]|nr:GATOR complex protein NPRL3 [Pteropus vampyrus]